MSDLEKYNKDELLAMADQFGSDQVNARMKKETIIKELEKDGITAEMYEGLKVVDPDEPVELALLDDAPLNKAPEPENEEDMVLVRMTRKNHSYEIRGHKFTQQHPYALVGEDDAEFLVTHVKGFRDATRAEIREFYSQ